MGQWEYRNSIITVEDKQYIMPLSDGSRLMGLDAIMNYWAASGWELVTLVPTNYEGFAHGDANLFITKLFATFKRYQEIPQQGYQSSRPGLSGPPQE